ncbi:hypothetical protein AXF42_Ash002464 [Apostasia shenzhenica]|uniref:glycerophosphodiester phosphodiesterase n=1 Tax=Apostasia shenzhenica TaxID=1088818 RepID=A0A2I0ANM5_9ASPA|nr:hypothetical protein AXF42_Ash002464 [Apostasia shenzhenica]
MRSATGHRQWTRPRPPPPLPLTSLKEKHLRLPRILLKKRHLLRLLVILAFLALTPPIFFHFRLRRLYQMRLWKCGWLESPPLVCAHGGDSSRAAPNTMEAYRIALDSHVDCIEIDISRSLDGTLFALHDRDLQRMSGNITAKVGFLSTEEISRLDAGSNLGISGDELKVPTVHEALTFVSSSVRLVILDVKVGPPSFENDLAKNVLSVVRKSGCKNCLIWAKSDTVGRDIVSLTEDAMVGYIVMKDPLTGATSDLLRMKGAQVAGVYHPLIDKMLVEILHRCTGTGKKSMPGLWTMLMQCGSC